jgi:hypothetical protein
MTRGKEANKAAKTKMRRRDVRKRLLARWSREGRGKPEEERPL